jgi:hypothetical protein
MHSPAPGSPLFLPWVMGETSSEMQTFLGFYPSENFRAVIPYVAGYLAVGLLLVLWGGYDRVIGGKGRPEPKDNPPEEE